MKIFDTELFCGSWPFNEYSRRAPASLIRRMDSAGIQKGIITSISALFEQENLLPNRNFLKQMAPYRGRLVPALSVNPVFSSCKDVIKMAADYGCALKLLPGFHGYALSDAKCGSFLEKIENQSMPVIVQLRFFEERTRPAALKKLPDVSVVEIIGTAETYPGVKFVFSSPTLKEASELLKRKLQNTHVTSSFIEGEIFLKEVFSEFATRVIFGSNFPVLAIEPGIAKITLEDISLRDKQLILFKNITRVFGGGI